MVVVTFDNSIFFHNFKLAHHIGDNFLASVLPLFAILKVARQIEINAVSNKTIEQTTVGIPYLHSIT